MRSTVGVAFPDKLAGALYGAAIGDAMGAPVEGWPSTRVFDSFGAHDFASFLPATHAGDPALGKGSGRITDDTLMTEALILAYEAAGDHLDAYGYAQYLLPLVHDRPTWIPEWGREAPVWQRLFYPEQYPWLRLAVFNAEPRTAGVGNLVNCGVAMWMMPVGAIHAGDPAGAYQEAVAIGSAHNESFAVEAGAVMAAAAAAAFGADASLDNVLATARFGARDGTRAAIRAALDAADPNQDLQAFVRNVRAAVARYDSRSSQLADEPTADVGARRAVPLPRRPDAAGESEGEGNAGRPSRTAAIEELPVALAALYYGGGDWMKTLRAAVLYGRDCDSIAGMAGALYGALFGRQALPDGLCHAVDQANRRDFRQLAERLCRVARAILAKDAERLAQRRSAQRAGDGSK